jgi:hypothetical protein
MVNKDTGMPAHESSVQMLRESLFSVFYVMTEQNNQHSKRILLRTMYRCILYLIDAGQVMRAIILPEFGWNPEIQKTVQKCDLLSLIFDVVCCKIHRPSTRKLGLTILIGLGFA